MYVFNMMEDPTFEPEYYEESDFGDTDVTTPTSSRLPEPPVLTPPNARQLGALGDNIQNLRDELRASELNDKKIDLSMLTTRRLMVSMAWPPPGSLMTSSLSVTMVRPYTGRLMAGKRFA